MFEPYSPCPCGSGKKFKWCCQPIHESLAKIFALDEEGQHEAALRMMDEVAETHSTNPEVWGRKALLLFQNEKPDEAEQTLDKAFALQPNYAFGFFLKARFRLFEGEIAGALLLLRKAADLYDPEAKEILAQIYLDVFDCEMKLNHPIAAHAAAEWALKFNPADENLRKGILTVFGKDNPNLPPSAVKKYEFKSLAPSASEERRTAWAAALKSAATGKLSDASKAFEQLTQSESTDPAAWYNLALCHAWVGNNTAGVQALDRYVAQESDEKQAAEAWKLAEVLRLGQGMEDEADTVEYSVAVALRDPNAFVTLLSEMERDGFLVGVRVSQEEGMLTAMILEQPPPALTPELQAKQSARLGAYLILVNDVVRLWNVSRENLEKSFEKIRAKLGPSIAQARPSRGPAKFLELLSEGISFGRNAANKEEAEQRLREGFQKFLDERWITRPLKSLGGASPAEAASSGASRKKLRGVVEFLRECAELAKFPCDFTPLLVRLGLSEPIAMPKAASATPASGAASPARDISTLDVAALDQLTPASMSPAEVEQAYHAAVKLDARELAGKFAADLTARPPYAERTDRFPLFQLLISQAIAKGDVVAALDRVNDGERDDCENNGGKRRNDYELRRAQVHVKRGEFDAAEGVYDSLIGRNPSELNVRVNAAEVMLSARQPAKALKYAQQGLAEAVKQNNRDLEGHFKELLAASQK